MIRCTRNRAFTLIEVLIATVLVGMAIAALVGANVSFTMANGAGAELSTAEFLIEQIREMTAMLPVVDPESSTTFGPEEPNLASYDDVDDFHGAVFSPPINADRADLTALADYSQQITVAYVNPQDFDDVLPSGSTSDFLCVTVRVTQNAQEISAASWIRAKY